MTVACSAQFAFEQTRKVAEIARFWHVMIETAALREYYVAMQDDNCCYANKSVVFGIWYT